MTPKELLKSAGEGGRWRGDLRFADPPNARQRARRSIPRIGPCVFVEGLGFDGPAIRCRREIPRSEMMDVCDPNTAAMDPSMPLHCSVERMIVQGQVRFPTVPRSPAVTIDMLERDHAS